MHTRVVRYALVLLFLTSGGCYLRHGLADEDAGHRDAGPFDAGRDAGRVDAARPDVGVPDAGVDGCIGPDCDLVVDLDGLRWELPCREHRPSETVCDTDDELSPSFSVRGTPGARYLVTLRFRGVVETAAYEGGAADGPFYVGGRHYGGAWNLYALDVSSPSESYFLNNGPQGDYFCVAIDYTRVVPVDAGSRITLRARSIDAAEITNRDASGDPISIPDVPPFPDAFDGQFIRMDVLDVRRAP